MASEPKLFKENDKPEPSILTRRDFNAATVMAILSGVAITISGCGDSSSPSSPTPTTPTTTGGGTGGAGSSGGGVTPANVAGVVSNNHGHSATVTGAQLSGGASVTLDIQGTSNHPHTVSFTTQELAQIQAGTRLVKVSTNNSGHTHNVTFN